MSLLIPDRTQREIGPLGEEFAIGSAESERTARDIQLDRSIRRVFHQAVHKSGWIFLCYSVQFLEKRAPDGKIYRTAIVGIHQCEIPKLAALIEIRHARRSDLEQNRVLRRIGPDGKAKTVEVFATGLTQPFGIAFYSIPCFSFHPALPFNQKQQAHASPRLIAALTCEPTKELTCVRQVSS